MSGRQSISNHGSAGVGVVPRAEQLDFEKEEKKIQQFEQTNKKFYKDVKYYVDKIDELNKSETKMINNLTNLVNTAGMVNSSIQNSKASANMNNQAASSTSMENTDSNDQEFISKLRLWKDLLNEHNKSCDSLKQTCQTQVIEPMKNLNMVFPQVTIRLFSVHSVYYSKMKFKTHHLDYHHINVYLVYLDKYALASFDLMDF